MGDKSEMDLKLRGQHALITGSSKGIGEAIARVLALEGTIVTVHGRDREQTERVASSILSQGGQAYAVMGDLTEDEAVERLVREAEEMAGAVAILVNNARGSGGVKETWEDT
jgi:NAD(P)-dependent dehydrogenase (short-subunit alcohol dehydrogenase family)